MCHLVCKDRPRAYNYEYETREVAKEFRSDYPFVFKKENLMWWIRDTYKMSAKESEHKARLVLRWYRKYEWIRRENSEYYWNAIPSRVCHAHNCVLE